MKIKRRKIKKVIKAIKLKKIVIFVILFLIIFAIFYYKNFLFGNNISKNRSANQIEDILNSLENYYAEADVTVSSNKTQNRYEVKQEVKGKYCMQEVISGASIEGVKIEINENQLKVSNTKLNLEKVYEDYENLLDNAMFLNSFIANYRDENNEVRSEEKENEIILEVKLKNHQNTYIKYKKLSVDKSTLMPTKLEVQDDTKKETICILYNNIELKKL